MYLVKRSSSVHLRRQQVKKNVIVQIVTSEIFHGSVFPCLSQLAIKEEKYLFFWEKKQTFSHFLVEAHGKNLRPRRQVGLNIDTFIVINKHKWSHPPLLMTRMFEKGGLAWWQVNVYKMASAAFPQLTSILLFYHITLHSLTRFPLLRPIWKCDFLIQIFLKCHLRSCWKSTDVTLHGLLSPMTLGLRCVQGGQR